MVLKLCSRQLACPRRYPLPGPCHHLPACLPLPAAAGRCLLCISLVPLLMPAVHPLYGYCSVWSCLPPPIAVHLTAAATACLPTCPPHAGYAVELSAAVVIIVGSRYGLPLSTTHW